MVEERKIERGGRRRRRQGKGKREGIGEKELGFNL